MLINDFFQMNDWNIRHCFVVILSLLLAFWGSIAADILGFPIPLFRQFIGFLLLTFVPGILILRILRIHHLGPVKTTIYAAGLSLAVLMFTGFFLNITYPLFGIYRPISLWPLIATISILIGFLCFFAWFRDWDFATPKSINLREVFFPPVLALSLLPFGAIFGTYLMNFYGTNILLMILLPIAALVPVVITCTQFIPKKYYPYAIFSLAITLLCHTALISTYVWGCDIQYEYYLINAVIQNSIWDFTTYSTCNAMLSLVTLAPTYSILSGMALEWVLKIIYPFFFALVPVGLYAIFQKQTNEKIAFLACFFFMSIFVFYGEMLSLARQEVAELFLVLILLSTIDRGLSKQQRKTLLLIFTASLVVSHYGLSYIFMLMLLIALAITVIEHHISIQDRTNGFFDRLQKRTGFFTGFKLQKRNLKLSVIPSWFVVWYSLFLLVWYIYMAGSSSFKSGATIARRILGVASTDLLNPETVQGMAMVVNEASTSLHEVAKYLHLLTIFFIIVGFTITIMIRQDKIRFDTQYLLLSCGALGICIGGVTLPYFASALNTTRLYQISLILLAPFGIIGGMALISGLRNLSKPHDRSLRILSVFLGIFLLFNCGWVYEVCKDEPTSFALNNSFDSLVLSEQEISSSLWLTDMKDSRLVAADKYRRMLLSSFLGDRAHATRDIQTAVLGNADYYMFIGQHNILHQQIVVTRTIDSISSTQFIEVTELHNKKNAIYNNGGSKIYYPGAILT